MRLAQQNALGEPNNLAGYACHWQNSKGRFYPATDSTMRSPYQRDRDRIIHSTAFRRLMHKTQVLISPSTDHVRTRLTHTIEVAQIARSMARILKLDEDLTEAIALAHDLGHPPFGHTGEDTLNAMMQEFGGFDHNDQAVRILTLLEKRYPDHDGLNLSWETLEGIVKHNGPLVGKLAKKTAPVPETTQWLSEKIDLDLASFASLEAQLAAIADDIAYNHHDMDDGLRAGFFTLKEIGTIPHVGKALRFYKKRYPDCQDTLLFAQVIRALINEMVEDVIQETRQQISAFKIQSLADVRTAPRQIVAFSPSMQAKEQALKSFLFTNMYRSPSVQKERIQAEITVKQIFTHYLADPETLPDNWYGRAARNDLAPYLSNGPSAGLKNTARIVSDYIAGMTDRFAIKEAGDFATKSEGLA